MSAIARKLALIGSRETFLLNLREKFGEKDHYSYLGKTDREMLINLPKAMTEFESLMLFI